MSQRKRCRDRDQQCNPRHRGQDSGPHSDILRNRGGSSNAARRRGRYSRHNGRGNDGGLGQADRLRDIIMQIKFNHEHCMKTISSCIVFSVIIFFLFTPNASLIACKVDRCVSQRRREGEKGGDRERQCGREREG